MAARKPRLRQKSLSDSIRLRTGAVKNKLIFLSIAISPLEWARYGPEDQQLHVVGLLNNLA